MADKVLKNRRKHLLPFFSLEFTLEVFLVFEHELIYFLGYGLGVDHNLEV